MRGMGSSDGVCGDAAMSPGSGAGTTQANSSQGLKVSRNRLLRKGVDQRQRCLSAGDTGPSSVYARRGALSQPEKCVDHRRGTSLALRIGY